jgi:tRNA(Ile)-lysidine synthase
MEGVLAAGGEWPGVVAVSGGADSLALLLLLAGWAAEQHRPPPVALTVDHGLQPASAKVANNVAATAKRLGLEAHVLQWTGRKPNSDVEATAREARYRLMGASCRKLGIRCLYVAHTQEDQAETFLLRLMRGSGVDGLAAMAPVAPFPSPDRDALCVARPLLSVPRASLRGFLASRDQVWFDDPMNADPRFARAKLRAAWPALEQLGFSAKRTAAAANHLARARIALEGGTTLLLVHASRTDGRAVLLDGAAVAAAPEEIALRAVARALMQVSGRIYRPRFERLEQLVSAIRLGQLKGGRTLHGCCVKSAPKRQASFGAGTIRIEPEAGSRATKGWRRARQPGC